MRKRCLSVSSLWYRNKRIDYGNVSTMVNAFAIAYEYKKDVLGHSSINKKRDIRSFSS